MPGPEPDWLVGVDGEAEVNQAILENWSRVAGAADGAAASRQRDRLETTRLAGPATPGPAELRAARQRTLADREVRESLNRISAAGARGVYRSVDVRDAEAVRSVLDDVRATLGPIRGLVHAAGVLADRRIEDKSPQQFAAVFDTKVAGLRNLLGAVPLDELRHVVLFSSVSARFGNPGQVDYAMANEVLNKVAHRLAAELPSCRVVSLNWGPWEGGMVRPALRRVFARRGVALIPIEAGARCFVDELGRVGDGAVEVIVGAGLGGNVETSKRQNVETSERQKVKKGESAIRNPQSAIRSPAAEAGFSLAFERKLDLERHPFLSSHVLDGYPVLPVAVMMEWLGQAAVHQNPGLLLHGFDELRVLKGVVLREGPEVLRLVAAKARRDGTLFKVDVELRGGSAEGSAVVHARTTAVLAATLPARPTITVADSLGDRPYDRGVEGAYAEVLFHGEHFHGIEAVEGYSERGMVARLCAAPAPSAWMSQWLRTDWLTDPLVLDSGFQMGILWCHEELGAVGLPTYLERYRQFQRAFPPEGVRAVLEVRERTPHRMTGDITFLDHQGGVVARVERYACLADASLMGAFKRARRPVAGATS
jgi:NAD(P)-dependent dehydrogenase (short-subunit alcohol dehydrogenase family)